MKNREQVIRGDRQGLFYGKSDASRYGTHLVKNWVHLIAEVRHRRIICISLFDKNSYPHAFCVGILFFYVFMYLL